MDETRLVPRGHAQRRVAQDAERGAQRDGIVLAGQALAQAFAQQQLHHQVVQPRRGAVVQHRHQVGVQGQPRGHLRLPLKAVAQPLHLHGVHAARRVEHLYGDLALRAQVGRAKDDAEAALAQHRLQPVMVVEHVPDKELRQPCHDCLTRRWGVPRPSSPPT